MSELLKTLLDAGFEDLKSRSDEAGVGVIADVSVGGVTRGRYEACAIVAEKGRYIVLVKRSSESGGKS